MTITGKNVIHLTIKAEQQIKTLLSKRQKGIGIRLSVKTTGCSGLAYTLEYVDQIQQDDIEYAFFGFMVLVDPKAINYLNGLTIDYTKKGLNEGFEFINPNERAQCGCGKSFTV